MKKYTTDTKNLLNYLPLVEFTKDEVLLLNFIRYPSDFNTDNGASFINQQLQSLINNKNPSFIVDKEKTSEFISLANKNYSQETFSKMIYVYSLLFNNNILTFDNNFSLNSEEQLLLLAKYFSDNPKTSFWSNIEPNFAPFAIEDAVSSNADFSQFNFESVVEKSQWQEFIEPEPIQEVYSDLSSESYDIFEHSKLDKNDPLNIVFLLEKINDISLTLNSRKKIASIIEWQEILNVPSPLKSSFYDQFSKLITTHHKNSYIHNLKNHFYNKTLKDLSHETIMNPLVLQAMLDTVINPSHIQNTSDPNNSNLLFTNPVTHQLFIKYNILNSSEFLKLAIPKLSPLFLLNIEPIRDSDLFNFNFSQSIHMSILQKFSLLTKEDQTFEKILSNEDVATKEYFNYFSTFLKHFEQKILSSPHDLTVTLDSLKKSQNDLFLLGFPFFSDEFKNNPKVLEKISSFIFHVHKKSGGEDNPIINAILNSYSEENLDKHKKYLFNFSTTYFMTLRNNHGIDKANFPSTYVNKLVEKMLAKEFLTLLQDKSMDNVDIDFLNNMFKNFPKNGEISQFINLVNNHPEISPLGDKENIQELVPYFLSSLEKIKNNNELPKGVTTELIALILNITSTIVFYAKVKNEDMFNDNILNITVNNFSKHKQLLALTAHFSMINKEFIDTLDISIPKHQEVAVDIIAKFSIKVSNEIIKYPQIKPFFMLDSVIQELQGKTKFVQFNKDFLTLGHIYSSSDVKTLFERYGHDNKTWFNFCPDTLLSLAPMEYKQSSEMWRILFKKHNTTIIPYIPLNIKNNPDFFIELISINEENLSNTFKLFPSKVINSLKVIQHVLENNNKDVINVYPELYKYLNSKSKELPGLSNIQLFDMLFGEKILDKAIPVNKTTVAVSKPKKF